ncbi:MAG: leucine--tRNA ligase [Puniceicoccaceae bacterium]
MSGHADYNFRAIEPRWQEYWETHRSFRAEDNSSKPKYYLLDMFPYPSGAGLHAGHTENYTASDILDRYQRAKGYNVLHPMGWDAFGLPAEQYAMKTGTHPAITTRRNIEHFTAQIKRLGIAIDWEREINTTDPSYFRWTQWIFLQLFKHGLAYVDERPVNWCPELGTVLANEEVIDGRSEVGGFPVERRALRQWVLRITAYADKLLAGLDNVDWPDSTKTQQTNWIGRSTGAEIDFELDGHDTSLKVFTTRPDTLFGATYMVIAPEHPLVRQLTTEAQLTKVEAYVAQAANKSDLDRTDLAKEKTGIFTGSYAINPVNGAKIPIWVADYVLMGYGTGAIMAVPAHDTRDFEFATAFDLPIVQVIADPDNADTTLPYTGDGRLVNSGPFDGNTVEMGKSAIIDWLATRNAGKATVNYRLRDWLFSRQRYWGEPFPILWVDEAAYKAAINAKGRVADFLPESPITYSDSDGTTHFALPVVPECLPLTLPETDNYKPSGDAQSPLANIPEWVNVWVNVETGETLSGLNPRPAPSEWVAGRRETNTMPQWAGSCWYYLRYCDPRNSKHLIDPEKERYWGVPDLYIGGAEHAVLHLLYARFWHIFLHEIGVVTTPEPFTKLFHQGIILGEMEYRLYRDSDGNPVSADSIADPNQWSGTVEKLDESQVQKSKINKVDIYHLPDNANIRIEAKAFKMSKSRGNVVNPDDYIERYGADSLRMYEMFMGPLADMKPWSSNGIEGPHRFLKKVWKLIVAKDGGLSPALIDGDEKNLDTLKLLNATIEKVSSDIESLSYNTAISQLMILVNTLQKADTLAHSTAKALVQMLAPFAPHLAEELWERLGEAPSVAYAPWPKPVEIQAQDDQVKVIFQVNGKLRGEGWFAAHAKQDEVEAVARAEPRVTSQIDGKQIVKVIYVPGKILNIVAR